MTIEQFSDLVSQFQKFSIANYKGSAEDFAYWLLQDKLNKPEDTSNSFDDAQTRQLGYLFNKVVKLNKILGKNMLVNTGLKSGDEFTLLNTIYNNQGIGKAELYKKAVFETSTGTQILKRLTEQNLVIETTDKKDKRITRLQITAKGKKIRDLMFDIKLKEIQLRFSVLSSTEKKQLLTLLKKLDASLMPEFLKKS